MRHYLAALLIFATASIIGACTVDAAADEPATELSVGDGKSDGSFTSSIHLTQSKPWAYVGFTCSELVHCSADIALSASLADQTGGVPELKVEITRQSDGGSAVFEVAQTYGGGRFVWRTERRHADLFADGEFNNTLHVRSWDPRDRFTIRIERSDLDATTPESTLFVGAAWK